MNAAELLGLVRRTLSDPGRRLIAAAALALLALLALSSGYTYRPFSATTAGEGAASAAAPSPQPTLAQLQRERERLRSALRRTSPRGTYIVVDRSNNRVYLRQKDRVLLDATASAGSGYILREENGRRRTWVFDTPQGAFRVLSKVADPVWKKPDWAFVEQGEAIPGDPGARFEYGTLGEYALYFGDGFMIHGTLYERLLGRSVTHGCIRLGRKDLERVYRATDVGTPIFIF